MRRPALHLAAFAIAAALLAQAAAVPALASTCAGYEDIAFCGEVTGNCSITSADALKALRIAVGALDFQIEADWDGSGEVTSSDALAILRAAVGLLGQSYACDPDHVVLTAVSSGLYFDTGFHESGNYAVGWYATSQPPMVEIRDYFVFDLSAVSATITAARLDLTTAPGNSIKYGSQDPSETFTLFEVDTPIAGLDSGAAGTGAFSDLGGGDVYGSFVASAALGALAEVPFSPTGVAALNAASGKIAIGGAITTLTKGAKNEFLFNATSEALTRRLVLTIE